jgi:hypothetical protein
VVQTVRHLGHGVFRNVRTLLHMIIWVLNYQNGLECPVNITLFYPVFFKQLYIQMIQSGEGGTWVLKGVRPPSCSLKYDCMLFGSVSGGDFGPPDQ